VGLDNVEVAAATARGVMVVNAPTSNIVSAAERILNAIDIVLDSEEYIS
jgi:D-3-phosphoglycerate dehydrogenase